MNKSIGVCLGASTVTLVKLAVNNTFKVEQVIRTPHDGNPRSVLIDKLKEINAIGLPISFTGRKFRSLVNLNKISEPEATELAYQNAKNDSSFSSIASLGGETFMVYLLDEEGRINNVVTKNQCASGTGEFFLQQIKRMNLDIDEATSIAKNEEPFKVSGRCSVFCKSDCTHALNKGVPKSEVTAGLSLMIADKVEELLNKDPEKKVILIGGVTQNEVVMNFIKEKFPDSLIPNEANYFEAYGAAIYAAENEVEALNDYEDIFNQQTSSFAFHKPLKNFQNLVKFESINKKQAIEGQKCLLGLDVGSTTTKAVLIDFEANDLLASVYLYTNGNPIKAARDCYSELQKQVPININIVGLGTTGSGRHIAGLHALTDGVFNEIIAHATAAVHFDKEVDTIFEIGGQDAKYTYLINKVPADYAMNEACSAGTGSFIEEAAWESLGIKVQDIQDLAFKGDSPPNFSDQCAAFINSDIATALQEDFNKNDVLAGLVYSICLNYVNRVKGNRQVGNKIFMQGGVCYNKAIPVAMAALTGKEIIVPPEPGLMGAYGVALEVKEKIELGLIEEKDFNLNELTNREVNYKKPFICLGGKEKCDRKCPINIIEIEGKKYPFGGACNKYYNINKTKSEDYDKYDLVKLRNKLMFDKYAPQYEIDEDAKTIGINYSFHTLTLWPFYYNFFSKLGFKVVIPDKVEEEGLEREVSSFCYPAQLSLGLFQDLLNKNPDYIFNPQIYEMYVEESEYHRLDFNCTCVFVSGEAMYLKQAFKDHTLNGQFLSPQLNFSYGFDTEKKKFHELAKKLGIKDRFKIQEALDNAYNKQIDFRNELYKIGRSVIKELESNPDEFAIVLIGRPYNAFTEIANKGIPKKFASRNVRLIPYDMLDYRDEKIDNEMYWEGGKKILKAAKIVKNHPQLFANYITNFSCGPDSMIISSFREIMGTKPSLTLELDGHTADAGINTRIEAALDIITNYRKVQKEHIKEEEQFQICEIESEKYMSFLRTPSGERFALTDPDVEVLIPSMGDLSAQMFAAVFRSMGINATACPESNNDILKYGRSVATGKECLPLILLAGSLIDHLENKWDGKKKIAYFVVQGAGNCRLGQYPVFLRSVLRRKKIDNVALMVLMNEDGFAGIGPEFAKRAIQALIATDVADDIRSAIMANSYDPEQGIELFDIYFRELMFAFESDPENFMEYLEEFALNIKENIPAKIPIQDSKYIALLGEIYVRRDGFAHKWLNKSFAKKGFVVKDAYISEWIIYVDEMIKMGLLEPEKSISKKVEQKVRSYFTKKIEQKIKEILAKSGYYEVSHTDIQSLLNRSKHIIPLEFKGEPGLTLGCGLHEGLTKYCGVINVGPFGCMPTRFTDSVAVPEMKVKHKIEAERLVDPGYKLSTVFNGNTNIPFLTIESDGNVYPQVIEARLETFALQAERIAGLMKIAKSEKI